MIGLRIRLNSNRAFLTPDVKEAHIFNDCVFSFHTPITCISQQQIIATAMTECSGRKQQPSALLPSHERGPN